MAIVGIKLIKSFVPHSRCFGSYFDVIILMFLVSSDFSFKPTSSSSSSSSTQFSQEWVCRKVVVKHSIKSNHKNTRFIVRTLWPTLWHWGGTIWPGGTRPMFYAIVIIGVPKSTHFWVFRSQRWRFQVYFALILLTFCVIISALVATQLWFSCMLRKMQFYVDVNLIYMQVGIWLNISQNHLHNL